MANDIVVAILQSVDKIKNADSGEIRSIQDQIEHNVFQTFYFYTIGLIGGCAVKSKALALPEFDGPAAIYVRKK